MFRGQCILALSNVKISTNLAIINNSLYFQDAENPDEYHDVGTNWISNNISLKQFINDYDLYNLDIIVNNDDVTIIKIDIVGKDLNIDKIIERIKLHVPFYTRGIIIKYFRDKYLRNTGELLLDTIIKKLENPIKYELIEEDKKEFKILFSFQENNIRWMRYIEDKISQKQIQLRDPEYIQLISSDKMDKIYFNINTNNFMWTIPETAFMNFNFSGGILMDEMGCGKTACVISHILSKQIPELNNIIIEDDRIKSKAALIIIPNHIGKQWISEIQKFNPNVNSKVSIINITNKKEYHEHINKDFINADFVIIPFQFLFNDIMTELSKEIYSYATGKRAYAFNVIAEEHFNIYVKENVGRKNILNEVPNIFFFKWHRIIIDECQEFICNKNYNRKLYYLNVLKAAYKWCMSGTPFGGNPRTSFNEIASFICGKKINIRSKRFHIELIKNKIFRRNTKKSTIHETNLGNIKITNTIKWIKFTPDERMIYASHQGGLFGIDALRQFCCCPFTMNISIKCKSFDEIIVMMKKKIEDALIISTKEFEHINGSYEHHREQYINALSVEMPQNIINQIKSDRDYYEKKKIEKEKVLKEVQSALNYYNIIDNEFKSQHEICCPICYRVIKNGEEDKEEEEEEIQLIAQEDNEEVKDTIMTKCGHLFCAECFYSSIETNNKCPTCRQPVNKSDAFIINMVETEDDVNISLEERELYKQFGSKVAQIIIYINEVTKNPDNYIILFSEWETILSKVRDALNAKNIKTVICKGNKNVREAAIRNFNNGRSIRVIGLSSQYASQGTNLVKANKIIFINPVSGSIEHRNTIESQAIARSYRLGQTRDLEIVRFIVKDTIEEEIYKDNLQNEMNEQIREEIIIQ